jgi:hypothetical protein
MINYKRDAVFSVLASWGQRPPGIAARKLVSGTYQILGRLPTYGIGSDAGICMQIIIGALWSSFPFRVGPRNSKKN